MKKTLIIAVTVLALAAVAWLIFIRKPSLTNNKAGNGTAVEPSGLGGQLYGQVQQNPADNLPETNPFEKDLNPYKGAYVNPF